MRLKYLVVGTVAWLLAAGAAADPRAAIDEAISAHPELTGSLVLEHGEQSLLARAWLVDHARDSIEVQYFIWSTDNIGILASEALLRAAERGVAVRVIVDDLLIDAPDETLLALAAHPSIDIRIYNPMHSVGVPWYRRLWGAVTDFRGSNQRMHDKVLIVDGELAITGGRNMADEYFDYDHDYNFRDRDALVLGSVVSSMRASFERFWSSELAVPVELLLGGDDLVVSESEVERVHAELSAYAADGTKFAPEVRAAIAAIPADFSRLAAGLAWGRVDFVSDLPGKNSGAHGLGGGGLSSAALGALVGTAQSEVLIQSPYLVVSEPAFELFRELRARGVRIRISTNSLASTDNLKAFSGYLNQRDELLAEGIEVFEYRPDPQIQGEIMDRYAALRAEAPVFAVHAKSLVVDRRAAFVGTYNLDPRSENLNTEVGVIIHDVAQAAAVADAIATDMLPANSWNAATDDPDRYASSAKRVRAWVMSWLPLKPVL
ncbi:MAG TPA: phospholipase D family protein [Gammaproteobacteria bacterium]|nr:phospholipase D family protein [Gammaproteobacteria bacterium]